MNEKLESIKSITIECDNSGTRPYPDKSFFDNTDENLYCYVEPNVGVYVAQGKKQNFYNWRFVISIEIENID